MCRYKHIDMGGGAEITITNISVTGQVFIFCFSSLTLLGQCGAGRGRAAGPVLGEGSWPLWAGLSEGLFFSLLFRNAAEQIGGTESTC